MELQAMPVVMAGKYIPEVCKSLKSRQAFLLEKKPTARLWKRTPKVRVYVWKNTQNRYFFFAEDQEMEDLIYIMHLNPLRFKLPPRFVSVLHRPAVYQGSVWRGSDSVALLGANFAADTFWSIAGKGRNLFSDSIQSHEGKAFWERRIGEAHSKGMDVYAVHFKSGSDNTIFVDNVVEVESHSRISKYWTYEVDKDESGMNWRFALVHRL